MRSHVFFLWLLVVLLTQPVQAQTSVFGTEWTKGSLLLTTGDTLRETLRFDLTSNLVQVLLADNTIKTYAARQFQWLQAYDPANMAERYFYTLPFAFKSSYKVPVLFEMLAEGTISLLGREKLVVVQNSWYGRPFMQSQLAYDFYFGFPDGRIRTYRGTRKDFEFLLKDKSGTLRNFIRESNLRYNEKNDLIRIINQYNYQNYNNKPIKE